MVGKFVEKFKCKHVSSQKGRKSNHFSVWKVLQNRKSYTFYAFWSKKMYGNTVLQKNFVHLYTIIRAITSAGVKNFPFYTSKTYFFYFTFLILQNSHISLSIIYLYFNKIFILFFYYFLHLFSSLPLSLPIRPNHHHPHYPIGEILNSKTIQD